MARTISEPVASFGSGLPRLGASRESSCSSAFSPGSSFALTTAQDGRARVGGVEVWERMESDPPSANEHHKPSSRSSRIRGGGRTARYLPAAEAGLKRGGSISSVARSASLGRDHSGDSLEGAAGYPEAALKRRASLDLVASRSQPLPEPDEADEDEFDYNPRLSVDLARRRKLPSYRFSMPFSSQPQQQRRRPCLISPHTKKCDKGLTRERVSLSHKKPRLGRWPSPPFIVEADELGRYHPPLSGNSGSSLGDLLEAAHRVGFNDVVAKGLVGRVSATPMPDKSSTMTASTNLSPTGTVLEATSEEEEDDGYEGDKTFSSVGTSASTERVSFKEQGSLMSPRTEDDDDDRTDVDYEDEARSASADKTQSDLDERDRECAQLLLGLGGATAAAC
jgi:hypothetical protein